MRPSRVEHVFPRDINAQSSRQRIDVSESSDNQVSCNQIASNSQPPSLYWANFNLI